MDRHDDTQPAIAKSDAVASPRAADAGAAVPDAARVVVWDVPAVVERGKRFTVKIGVTSSSARRSDGWQVEVRDHEGGSRATATVGEEPWPGTDALYHAEVALVAPEAEGLYTWEATAVTGAAAATGDRSATGGAAEPSGVAETAGAVEPGGVAESGGAVDPGGGVAVTGGAAEPSGTLEPGDAVEPGGPAATGGAAEPGRVAVTGGAAEPSGTVEPDEAAEPGGAADAHTGGRARFGVRVVSAPSCRVTVVALDADSRTPVEGARVVAHPYRAVTDERGMAELQVPAGEYRLFVSGRGCIPFRFDGAVTADTTIRAELEQDQELSDADIWS